ncbi:MAG: shikimate dehydrogenase [Acidimicrobiia bacterium]|nr:MAG: shikimate dehydrogenase [Acidimicrobiia bacterium]
MTSGTRVVGGPAGIRLALLGDPVGHSRSPAIHSAALAARGVAGRYEARRVDEAGLLAAFEEIRSGELDGANVTTPHKARAATACDHLSPEARAAGAVNTVAATGEVLFGWNTDAVAAGEMVATLPEAPILVLGAGPAAAAVLVGVDDHQRIVSARRRSAAQALADRLPGPIAVVEWGAPPLEPVVLVNATRIGMVPGEGASLPLDGVRGVIDLPYGDTPTDLVKAAGAAGIPFRDGVDFLVAQAAAAFEIWTGVVAPRAVMHAAATGT